MRRKKMWRYYCDYCKKTGGSGYHLKKHEKGCTLNPNRVCGFCGILEQPQSDLVKAMELLPEPKEYMKEDEYAGITYKGLGEAVEKTMPKLRDLVGNCPACIMAALRQKGIPVPMVESFDFKKECASVWADFNENQRRIDEESTYYE